MRTKDKIKNTFSIIHLSDLHIISHSGEYSVSLQKMIDHIYNITENNEKIILVFTGDLTEKGEFGKSEDVIYKFFGDLHDKIGNKIIDIIFVPGNHDKNRGTLLLKNLEHENDENFWISFKKNDWKYFENQFEDFLRIVKKIRKEIFKFDDTFEGTYGVQITKIEQYNICFLCINSAWMCMDKNDEGNLRIGRFQLDDLKKQYQTKKNDIDLVIALMHHPTDWLTKNEQKYLNQYMKDEYRLNTNIMLQGHIHEKETYNWYNQNHSLTTLVTGMGWDQQKELNDNGHRYSLYEINIDSSIIRVNTFVSGADGKFNEDTEVYKENNIIFPLFVHKYLEINKVKFKGSEYSLFFPDYNISENYEYISNGVNKFVMKITEISKDIQLEKLFLPDSLLLIKDIFADTFIDGKISWTEETKKDILNKYKSNEKNLLIKKMLENSKNDDIKDVLTRLFETISTEKNNGDIISEKYFLETWDKFSYNYPNVNTKNKFYFFIGSLCIELQKNIFKKELFDDDSSLRVHCRIVNVSDEQIKYKKLFSITVTKEKDTNKLIPKENLELSDINYDGSMIEKSYTSCKAMLQSLNPSSNSHISNRDWIDFLTIVPKTDYNNYKIDNETTVPYLSFGISVNNIKLQMYLRYLGLIGIEKTLAELLNSFFESTSFNISTLL